MKVLVDSQSGTVKGVYNPPLNFSISGKYIINIPVEAGPVDVDTTSPAQIITNKTNALMALHPLMSQSLGDEFLTTSLIDATSLTSGIIKAPNKGVVITPGGILMTTVRTITVPTLTRVSIVYYGFRLTRSLPLDNGPAPVLYNWDGSSFIEFGSGIFDVDIMDSIGTTVLVPNLESGVEYPYAIATPLNVRLRFTSLSTDFWYISDYLLLAG
jgi:hypothetical protein